MLPRRLGPRDAKGERNLAGLALAVAVWWWWAAGLVAAPLPRATAERMPVGCARRAVATLASKAMALNARAPAARLAALAQALTVALAHLCQGEGDAAVCLVAVDRLMMRGPFVEAAR